MACRVVEGTLDFVGNSVFSNSGPGVVEYSMLRVGGEEFRNVWAQHQVCNFEAGQKVRLFLARKGLPFARKWDLLAVETPNGRFSMGFGKALLLYLCLLALWALPFAGVAALVGSLVRDIGLGGPVATLIGLSAFVALLGLKVVQYARTLHGLAKF